MTHAEIEKFAFWSVDSTAIKITLESIRSRIEREEVLSIIFGAEYVTLINEINELCTYASTESEVTWVAEKITEMHKCILDDLLLLINVNGLKNSTSWELCDRKVVCERLLQSYKQLKLRNEDTEVLIEKCLATLTSITDGVSMGKEA